MVFACCAAPDLPQPEPTTTSTTLFPQCSPTRRTTIKPGSVRIGLPLGLEISGLDVEPPVHNPEHLFVVDRWRVFKRTAVFTLPLLIWPIIVNLGGFLDGSRLRQNLITVAVLVAVVVGVPLLRVLYVWRRRIEIGPDWICGPTEELFEGGRVRKEDVTRLEYHDVGKKIFVLSSRSRAIVVSPEDYPEESRSRLLDLLSQFDPKTRSQEEDTVTTTPNETDVRGSDDTTEKNSKHKPELRFGGLWPVIANELDARWAVKQGMWTAVVIAAFIAVSGVWSYLSPPPEIAEGSAIWTLISSVIDVGVYIAIAVGLYLNSRVAAVASLTVYLATRVLLWQPEHLGQIVLIAIFTLGFVSGIRGAFAHHRFKASRPLSPNAPLEP